MTAMHWKSGLAMALTLLALNGASAAPATYRFVGDIVGTLDGTAVSGRLTLTVGGDTDDLFTSGPAQRITDSIVPTFDLPGVGSFVVTPNASYVFARPDIGIVGFGVQDLAACCDIIQIRTPDLIGYDLNDAIGPVLGPPNPSLADWVGVPTSAGLFTVTSMSNNTFEAVIGAATVPEPGMPALLLLAGAGAFLAGRRRRSAIRSEAARGRAGLLDGLRQGEGVASEGHARHGVDKGGTYTEPA